MCQFHKFHFLFHHLFDWGCTKMYLFLKFWIQNIFFCWGPFDLFIFDGDPSLNCTTKNEKMTETFNGKKVPEDLTITITV